MKNKTIKIVNLQRFYEADIHEGSSIEKFFHSLFYDKYLIIQLLPLKYGMNVMQKSIQVMHSRSEIELKIH